MSTQLDFLPDHFPAADTQARPVGQEPFSPRSQLSLEAHGRNAPGGTQDNPQTLHKTEPKPTSFAGAEPPTGQTVDDTHAYSAGGGDNPPPDHVPGDTQRPDVGRGQVSEGGAMWIATPNSLALPSLDDPTLRLAADVVDDLENVRKANDNRLRQLTRGGWSDARIKSGKYSHPDKLPLDKDGEDRGFGLDESHPDVANLAALVQMITKAEEAAVKNLEKVMKRHPLGPWIKQSKGIGYKQGARLLAVIGDPYINSATGQPRTVSQLWAYCGLAPGQKRTKGVKSNWSADAKMRSWNIAGACLKAQGPYADFYYARKDHTGGRVHAEPCIRCGPSGKPALAGSPLSDGHRHADALRVLSKEILKDLWRESKTIHEQCTEPLQLDPVSEVA